ncbi:hypothetical protein [uncultured Alistipes sp.]|uniref:hypothetical protein n=1 Tax=uncultured Alistipes sp. TaxID=538949 RepID=UPI00260F6260|nr:hypothetical protein [uncultured Alistipes sp.]
MSYSIISCASFGASGSGVVTDYLQEFDNIYNPGDYEFRFLQDYGGITTLEDCLVHSRHRLNSDIAIRNFIQYVQFQCGDFTNRRYNRFFKGRFEEISREFLREIVDAEWPGYWEEYQILVPKAIAIIKYKVLPRLKRLLKFQRGKYIAHFLPLRPMYFSCPSEEKFHIAVKNYLNRLCAIVDPQGEYDHIYFDQLVPPTNIDRYFNYFENLKVIVVDCDPRDYYAKNMFFGEPWVPKNVEDFITVYRKTRQYIDSDNENRNILRIQYEDSIFQYPKFKKRVNEFLNLDETHHLYPLKHFDPRISVRYTRQWEKHRIASDIIYKIESELPEYCYSFPDNPIVSV